MEGKDYKELSSIQEAEQACYNYSLVIRHIHPYDVGPVALYQVVKRKTQMTKLKPDMIALFFKTVVDENGDRLDQLLMICNVISNPC